MEFLNLKGRVSYFPSFLLRASLSALIAFGPGTPVWAQVVADPANGARAPKIDVTRNGIPQVNITTPTQRGVSVNNFKEFNVGKPGLVVNNSPTATQSQIGGEIYGNGALQDTGSAKVIVNQVAGTERSRLNGVQEVVGGSAELITANPNGITCDGCGFLNTPRAVLTTGNTRLDTDGNLDRIVVKKGDVLIEGGGANASNTDLFEVISRTAKVTADVHANQLRVTAGRNDVDYESGVPTALEADGDSPSVAIDSTALGGMYADRIRIRSTEKGAGVNLDGMLGASLGQINITSNGQLVTGDISAKKRVRLSGDDVALSGRVISETADVAVESAGDLTLDEARVAADADVALSAEGRLSARNTNVEGKAVALRSGGGAALSGGSVRADDELTFGSGGALTAKGATLSGTKGVALTASAADLTDAAIISGGDIALKAEGQLSFAASRVIAMDALTLDFGGMDASASTLSAGLITAMGGAMTLSDSALLGEDAVQLALDDRLDLDALSSVETAGAAEIDAGTADVDGYIKTGNALSVDFGAGDLRLGAGAAFEAGEELTLLAGAVSLGDGAALAAAGDLTLDLASLESNGGFFLSGGAVDITASGQAAFIAGEVSGDAGLTLFAGKGISTSADMQTQGEALLSSGAALSVLDGGNVLASADVVLQANGALSLLDARAETRGALTLEGEGITIEDARLIGETALFLEARTGNTRALRGFLGTTGDLIARGRGGAVLNDTDFIGGTGLSLAFDQELAIGARSVVSSGGDIALSTDDALTLFDADIITDGALALEADGDVIIREGFLSAEGTLEVLAGGALTAQGAIESGGETQLASVGAATFETGGSLIADGGALIRSGGLLFFDAWALSSVKDLRLEGAGIEAVDAEIIASQSLGLDAGRGALDVRDTTLASTDAGLSLSAGVTALDDATLFGGTLINAVGSRLDETGSSFGTGGALSLSYDGALSLSGDYVSNETLSLTAGTTTLSGSSFTALRDIRIASTFLDANGADIQAGRALSLTSSGDTKLTGGQFVAVEDAALTSAGDVQVSATRLNAGGAARVTTGGDAAFGNGAVVIGDDAVQVDASSGALTVESAAFESLGTASLGAKTVDATDLRLIGTGDAALAADGAMSLSGGVLASTTGDLSVTGRTLVMSGTEALGGRDLSLIGDAITSVDGVFEAGRDLLFEAVATLTLQRDKVIGGGNTTVKAATLGAESTVISGRAARIEGNALASLDGARFEAAESLTFETNEAVTLNDENRFVSNGALTLSTGAFTSNVELGAVGDVSIASRGAVRINEALSAGGDLDITGALIVNKGGIGAVGDMTLVSSSDIRNRDIAVALENIAFRATGKILNNETFIQALNGDVTLEGATAGTRATSLLNSSGVISANGDLTVRADDVTNERADFSFVPSDGGGRLTVMTANGNVITEDAEITGFLDIDQGEVKETTGKIFRRFDYSDVLTGVGGSKIGYLADFHFVLNGRLETESKYSGRRDWDAIHTFIPTGCLTLSAECGEIRFANEDSVFAPLFEHMIFNGRQILPEGTTEVSANEFDKLNVFGPENALYHLTHRSSAGTLEGGPASLLSAGNNIVIDAKRTNNKHSSISAGNDLSVTGNRLNNVGAKAEVTETKRSVHVYGNYGKVTYNAGDHGPDIAINRHTKRFEMTESETRLLSGESFDAVMAAGGTIDIRTKNDVRTETVIHDAPLTDSRLSGVDPLARRQAASLAERGATSVEASSSQSTDVGEGAVRPEGVGEGSSRTETELGTFDTGALGPNGGAGVEVPSLSTFADPAVVARLAGPKGLFQPAAPEAGVVVESRLPFTDRGTFYGSDYFLERFGGGGGENVETLPQRLGDAFFDTQFVREQILAETGRTWISSGASSTDEMRRLLDNAVTEGSALRLTPGVALTAAQVANLETDIVWYEPAVYQGKTVLVPKLYVAEQSARITPQGSLLYAGGDLNIDTGGAYTNSGDIWARGSASIRSADDLSSTGGRFKVGEALRLTSEGGDVSITAKTRDVEGRRAGDLLSMISASSRLRARGDIEIAAAGDTKLVGTFVKTDGNARLTAGGDVNILSAETRFEESRGERGSRRFDRSAEIKQLGSSIEAAGDVDIEAGSAGDILLSASDVTAGGKASLGAGGEIIIASVEEMEETEQQRRSSGFLSKKLKIEASAKTTQRGASITADSLALSSGGSTTVSASDVTAADSLDVTAGGSVNLVEEHEETITASIRKKTGFFTGGGGGFLSLYGGKAKTTETFVSRGKAATLSAGGNVSVAVNGGDLNVAGSSITGDTVSVSAKRDINLTPGLRIDEEKTETKKWGIGISISGGFSSGSIFAGFEKTADRVESRGEFTTASVITGQRGVEMEAGRTLNSVAAVIQAPKGDVTLEAGKDVKLLPGADSEALETFYSKLRIGVTAKVQSSTAEALLTTIDAVAMLDDGISIAGDFITIASSTIKLAEQHGTLKQVLQQVQATSAAGFPLYLDENNQQTEVNTGKPLVDPEKLESQRQEAANAPTTVSDALGISGSVSFGGSYEESRYEQLTETARPTIVIAGGEGFVGDVEIKAGRDVRLEGAQITATGDTTLDAGRDLLLESAQSTHKTESSSFSVTASVGIGIDSSGGDSGFQGEASVGTSDAKSDSVYQTNAKVEAGETLTLRSGRDTTASGAVATGTEAIVDVGRRLTVQSRQDTTIARSNSKNAGISVSETGGSANVGGSIGSTDKAWVEDQTSILGTESLDAKVHGKTLLDGGVLAAEAADATTLVTGSLDVRDIEDHDYVRNKSVGVSVGASADGPSLPKVTGGGIYARSREQVNRGTLGTGDVTVRPQTAEETETQLAAVNRDLDRAQEITRDETFGAEIYLSAEGISVLQENAKAAIETLFSEGKISADETKRANEVVDRLLEVDPESFAVCGEDHASLWDYLPSLVSTAHASSSDGCIIRFKTGDQTDLSDAAVAAIRQSVQESSKEAMSSLLLEYSELQNTNVSLDSDKEARLADINRAILMQASYYELCGEDGGSLRSSGILSSLPNEEKIYQIAESYRAGGERASSFLSFSIDKYQDLRAVNPKLAQSLYFMAFGGYNTPFNVEGIPSETGYNNIIDAAYIIEGVDLIDDPEARKEVIDNAALIMSDTSFGAFAIQFSWVPVLRDFSKDLSVESRFHLISRFNHYSNEYLGGVEESVENARIATAAILGAAVGAQAGALLARCYTNPACVNNMTVATTDLLADLSLGGTSLAPSVTITAKAGAIILTRKGESVLVAPNRIPVPDDLPTNIHMGQQGKHVRGHNNFQEGRSYFNDGVDPSELLAGLHSGQYPIVGTGSRGNPIVDFGRPIGVDGRTGQTVTRGQIHYGNNGAHIVPDVRN